MKAHTEELHTYIRLTNNKFIITQIGTIFNTYNFASWNKPTYTHRTYMHIYICTYTCTYIPAYGCMDIGTYMHIHLLHTTGIGAWIFPALGFAPAGNRWLFGLVTNLSHKALSFWVLGVSQMTINLLRRVQDRWWTMTPVYHKRVTCRPN